ncbi:MAG: hypothetical protein ACJA1E_000547 [Paracoccaceae bacterium]|jgi:hypothetical protein
MNLALWQAICELTWLLEDRSQVESDYQGFFEDNPVVFPILGFQRFASYEKKSGNRLPYDDEHERQLEPDFICGNPINQTVTVFELKTPVDKEATTSLQNRNRQKFKAIVESHISQVSEYCEFISGNFNVRADVAKTLGLGGIKAVDGVLVYGLTDDEEAPTVAKLAARRSPPLSVWSFDGVLSELLRAYAIGRQDIILPDAHGNTPKVDGSTFVMHAVLHSQQREGKAYLFDIGDIGRNRLSIYINNGRGVIEITDSLGRLFTSEWDCKFNKPICIRAEYSNTDAVRFISVFINNRETDFRQSTAGAMIRPDFSKMFLGSDLEGRNGARFSLLENYFCDRIMTWQERVGSYRYFQSKTCGQVGSCLEFYDEQFMYRNDDGHLIQDVNALRPIYQEDTLYPDTDTRQ